jgi:hypothetical protein
LQSLYENIKKEAFKVPEDDGSDITRTFFNPDNEGFLTKEGETTTNALLMISLLEYRNRIVFKY